MPEQKEPAGDARVEITVAELQELRDAQLKLDALEGAGVDNWEGYDDAMDLLEDLRKNAKA